jgi:hypothetical protein
LSLIGGHRGLLFLWCIFDLINFRFIENHSLRPLACKAWGLLGNDSFCYTASKGRGFRLKLKSILRGLLVWCIYLKVGEKAWNEWSLKLRLIIMKRNLSDFLVLFLSFFLNLWLFWDNFILRRLNVLFWFLN